MSRIALHERRHSADFGWRNPAQDLQIEEPGNAVSLGAAILVIEPESGAKASFL